MNPLPLLPVRPLGPSFAPHLVLTAANADGHRLTGADGTTAWLRGFLLAVRSDRASPAELEIVVHMEAKWRLRQPPYDTGIEHSTDSSGKLYVAAGELRFFHSDLGFAVWDEEDSKFRKRNLPLPGPISGYIGSQPAEREYISARYVAIDLVFPTGAEGLSVAAFDPASQHPAHVATYGSPF
jgi:hypothetical protein